MRLHMLIQQYVYVFLQQLLKPNVGFHMQRLRFIPWDDLQRELDDIYQKLHLFIGINLLTTTGALSL